MLRKIIEIGLPVIFLCLVAWLAYLNRVTTERKKERIE